MTSAFPDKKLTIGRFAPTPSGPLHFGSLVAAIAGYCQAKSRQGQWLLRIEDVDTPRVVKGASDLILQDLEAFAFEWDGEVLWQSSQFEPYQHYLDQLLTQGDAYACECSRRMLREQGVDYGPLGQIYPGNCRDKNLPVEQASIRLSSAGVAELSFDDAVYGSCSLNLTQQVGDFVLKRVDQIYSYHLAVVVDDHLQGIDQIVRGADLIDNTPLHLLLQQRLGFIQPDYMHIPLVNNVDGVKLSKQTGAQGIDRRQAAQQLVAALDFLGQKPPPELKTSRPAEVLRWAIDHWNYRSITV
ncbi:MAG: glutamyl-Q tRNA(Asp) synthetase [Gammaproteobacteria bacterium]|jgi:glutamyl-Q tRNA(Asp) synthetase